MRFGGFFRTRELYKSDWAVRIYRGLRHVASALGLQVVLKTFYSPIPALDEIPSGTFERVSPLAGIDFDLDAQLRWLSAEIAAPMKEFRPLHAGNGAARQYAVGTASYPQLDATVLYGMIRRLRPRRVIELGSGASTLVLSEASRANARDGAPLQLDVFDPFPGVADDLPGLGSLRRARAQDVPLEVLQQLRDGDVLFVDTTHTVKLGSDVNFIVLDVLPTLAPGVVVHLQVFVLQPDLPRTWL
jgi:hypothetical protein